MVTVINLVLLLLVAALLITILAGVGRAPLWPALLLAIVANLVQIMGPR